MGRDESPVIFEDEPEPPGPPQRQRPLWQWLAVAAAALAALVVVVRPAASFHHTVPKPHPIVANPQTPYGDWVLTGFGTRDNGAPVTIQPAIGRKTLKLAATATNGDAVSILATVGCGTTSGQIGISRSEDGGSGTLSLGELATTASGCGNQSTAEADLASSLNYVFASGLNGFPHQASWSFNGTELVISSAPVVLTYARSTVAIDVTPALQGTSWKLANFTDADGVTYD
jgi:hypothetical protein